MAAAYATRIEARLGTSLSAEEIFAIFRSREEKLSRLLIVYIATGLIFMLLPGTFLGVWNLISISSRHAAASVEPAWIQAHGHAQIFGWIGAFILGIGFYSIPKLRRQEPFALATAIVCWFLWTAGVTLRWAVNVYLWHWRILVPLSGGLELLAFALFFHSVSGHKPPPNTQLQATKQPTAARFEKWVLVVIAATTGFMAALVANFGGAIYVAVQGRSPAFPPAFDQRFLVLSTWGFMVPFVWGFSAKWLPVFLGLKPIRERLLIVAVAANFLGVIAGAAGFLHSCVVLLLTAAVLIPFALRLFEVPRQPAKTNFVHPSYPAFIRLAYVWLVVAAGLGVWAASSGSPGVWGASRHALTVGFVATMVFSIGQRVLPAFSGMRLLFSSKLMFANLILLAVGCLLRVSSEVLAYQNYVAAAWRWLPVSAVIELSAVTLFALNLLITFAQRPPALQETAASEPAAR